MRWQRTNLLILLARALDWAKDPDPDHWKTINGSHVHLDKNGNYDGGAGSKFNGRHHYGPGWKQKSALMNRLAAALHTGVNQKNVAPQATNGGQGASNGGNLNTEEDYIKEIGRLHDKWLDNRVSASYSSDENSKLSKQIDKLKIEAASKGYVFVSKFKGQVSPEHVDRIKEKIKDSPEESGLCGIWLKVKCVRLRITLAVHIARMMEVPLIMT